jgi:hypothetical protein
LALFGQVGVADPEQEDMGGSETMIRSARAGSAGASLVPNRLTQSDTACHALALVPRCRDVAYR